MQIFVYKSSDLADETAAEQLARWLSNKETKNVMVAAGNSPLRLYGLVAKRKLALSHLNVFALDEYVGVPRKEPRNCANVLRKSVIDAWGISSKRYFTISSLAEDALASVQEYDRGIEENGGVDLLVLGLGQNGHVGFNEPGSAADSPARVVQLAVSSVEANRKWFDGDYAPDQGVTVGMQTLLGARRVIILAYGSHKTAAVKAMVDGPISEDCPASFFQSHKNTFVYLDVEAAAGISKH